ncbi:MAG: hypothetical protein AAGI52_01990 [Bacteroidota bacterium]
MGQQQLLLLVLGVVIVGLSVVVGIRAFEENADQARADRQLEAVSDVAIRINVWNQTPAILGGNLEASRSVTFARLGFDHEPSDTSLLTRRGTTCLHVFSTTGGYDAVRAYDINTCPDSRNDLDNDDLAYIVRVYEDHWRYYHMQSSDPFNWVRVDW